MFTKNKLWVGALTGLVIPFVGYALLLTIFEQLEASALADQEGFSSNFRLRTLTIIAICLNLIPLNIYNRRNMVEAIRGLVFPTTFYVIGWIIYFGRYIL